MNIVMYSFLYSIVKYERPLESDAKALLKKKLTELFNERMSEASQAKRKQEEWIRLADY